MRARKTIFVAAVGVVYLGAGQTGVDRISISSQTKDIHAIDLSMRFAS
jgi:nicotinate-nucleotide pyrophosphorylase